MKNLTNQESTEGEFDMDKIRSFPKFDLADKFKDPAVVAEFLTVAFTEGDPALIAEGLNAASRALGMADVASRANIGRESLYKALRPGSQPRLETILGVVKALGCQLVVQPIPAPADEETATG